MSDNNLIGPVVSILLRRNPNEPWMTATGLYQRLKREYELYTEPAEIELILSRYSQVPGRKIRYSYYPSRRGLDILWGHIDKVREQKYLPALERSDEPVEDTAKAVDEYPSFFISHNHLDLNHVIELRNQLAKEYSVWIFETEIPQGDQIIASVREAVQRCDYFISYVSARSIGSLWVQKEIEVALYGGVKEPYLFLDGEDAKLLNLFGNWGNTWPPDPSLTEEFCQMSANSVGRTNNERWVCRCKEFVEKVPEYLGSTERVVAFPSPKNKDLWKSKVKLESLSEFLERIGKQRIQEQPKVT